MLPGSPFVAWTRLHRFTTRCQTTLPVQWRATTQDLSASLSAERNAYVEHCPAMFGRIMDTRQVGGGWGDVGCAMEHGWEVAFLPHKALSNEPQRHPLPLQRAIVIIASHPLLPDLPL